MKRQQQGMTLVSMALVAIVAAMGLLMIFRLVPVYLEHYNISHVLKSMSGKAPDDYMSKLHIRKSIARKFEVNQITHIKAKDVLIRYRKGQYELIAKYDVVVPFMYNIHFQIQFDDRAVISRGN